MAAWRQAIELALGEEDTAKLRSIAQSRTEPVSRVERARTLLAYREDPFFCGRPAARTASPDCSALRAPIIKSILSRQYKEAASQIPHWDQIEGHVLMVVKLAGA